MRDQPPTRPSPQATSSSKMSYVSPPPCSLLRSLPCCVVRRPRSSRTSWPISTFSGGFAVLPLVSRRTAVSQSSVSSLRGLSLMADYCRMYGRVVLILKNWSLWPLPYNQHLNQSKTHSRSTSLSRMARRYWVSCKSVRENY